MLEPKLKGVNYESLGIQKLRDDKLISQWHVKRASLPLLAEKISNLLVLPISICILILEIHKD